MPEEWSKIIFAPLEKIDCSETQLKQLYEKQLNSPEIIQESINHFVFGMQHNKKFANYDNPLNVLMGVLRKGQGWFENGYKSPQELAQEAGLANTEERQNN